jgi:hypothetical protein
VSACILHASQTKILDDGTKHGVCVFEVLVTGVSTRLAGRIMEHSFQNAHATLCSVFQNLRLASIKLWTHSRSGVQFRCTLRWFGDQIEHSNHRKSTSKMHARPFCWANLTHLGVRLTIGTRIDVNRNKWMCAVGIFMVYCAYD